MCRPQTWLLAALLASLAALAGCNQAASGPTGTAQAPTVTIGSASLQAINLSADQNALPVGLSEQFQATGAYSDGTAVPLGAGLIWSSSDTSVLTVDSKGLATALAPGSASVTVQDPVSRAQGTLAVTVTTAVLESLSLSTPSASLPVGLGLQLSATGHFSDGTALILTAGVSWQSGNADIAAVDANGLVTAVAAGGPVAIWASFNRQSAAAQVTVSSAVLEAVTVTPVSVTLPAGLTVQLSAMGGYSDDAAFVLSSGLTWSSSNPWKASVSQSGLVNAEQPGEVIITVSDALTGLSASTTISVRPNPEAEGEDGHGDGNGNGHD